jgi:hypothetical protein
MASQASVRGPHPHRLRLDEVDEMALDIFDAAMGQTLEGRERILDGRLDVALERAYRTLAGMGA